MKNMRSQFITIKDKRKILINGEDMPTAIFSAEKKEYIVKPRGTIYGNPDKKGKRRR